MANLFEGRKWILAPMVRGSLLPVRLEALSYGADLVYTEEIIDKRLSQTVRTFNPDFGTIEYQHKEDKVVVFSTCPEERQRVIVQLGTPKAVTALQAAQHVLRDAAGIDINMGCPKSFSVKGGMGAALLKHTEAAADILKTLRRNLPEEVPLTCKIRMLPDLKRTIDLVRMCESCGIRAIAIHARQPHERPNERAHWDIFRPVQDALSIPVIANGDFHNISDVLQFEKLNIGTTGPHGIMIARGALWNPSIFIKPSAAETEEIIRRCAQALPSPPPQQVSLAALPNLEKPLLARPQIAPPPAVSRGERDVLPTEQAAGAVLNGVAASDTGEESQTPGDVGEESTSKQIAKRRQLSSPSEEDEHTDSLPASSPEPPAANQEDTAVTEESLQVASSVTTVEAKVDKAHGCTACLCGCARCLLGRRYCEMPSAERPTREEVLRGYFKTAICTGAVFQSIKWVLQEYCSQDRDVSFRQSIDNSKSPGGLAEILGLQTWYQKLTEQRCWPTGPQRKVNTLGYYKPSKGQRAAARAAAAQVSKSPPAANPLILSPSPVSSGASDAGPSISSDKSEDGQQLLSAPSRSSSSLTSSSESQLTMNRNTIEEYAAEFVNGAAAGDVMRRSSCCDGAGGDWDERAIFSRITRRSAAGEGNSNDRPRYSTEISKRVAALKQE